MAENHQTGIEPRKVECAVCKKLIPPSQAISPEALDYVLYFCGRQCYAEWERDRAEESEREFEQRNDVIPTAPK
jgi:hypothetical protein